MSRQTNYIGFTNQAYEKIIKSTKVKELETIFGMFGEPINKTYLYEDSDGKKFESFIQAEPWSSGPCTFMALRWADTKELINGCYWSEEEINSI
jgi:hypothetical protein